ncbi:hypothetical protein RCL1_008589 [Eukaryota sp. TZLM3-RCL]
MLDFQAPPNKRARHELLGNDRIPIQSPRQSHVELSSTVLGLCLYHAMNMRIDSLQQFISKKNQDMNKICLFLSKYAAISVNFRKSVLNSISYWIRNNQSTLDLRAYIAKKGSLISRLNFNSAPATVSIQLTPKQLLLYLKGTRALRNFERVISPEFVVSLNVIGNSKAQFNGVAAAFPFPNLQSLHVSGAMSWSVILSALSNFPLPNLIYLKLSSSGSERGTFDFSLSFPSSFSNIQVLEVFPSYYRVTVNVENLKKLTHFTLNPFRPSLEGFQVIRGLSSLPLLTTLDTPYAQCLDLHPSATLTCLKHVYDPLAFSRPIASNLIDFHVNASSQRSIHVLCLDFSKFFKVQRLELDGVTHNDLDLTEVPHLCELFITNCRFSRIIVSLLNNSMHTFVSKYLYGFGEDGTGNFVGFDGLDRLSRFELSSSTYSLPKLFNKVLSNIVDLTGNTNLFLKEIYSMNRLKTLKLSYNQELLSMPSLPLLKDLELCDVRGSILKWFTPYRVPKLRTLTLSGGTARFSDFPLFPSVLSLNISHVGGLGQFEFLEKFHHVTKISLSMEWYLELTQVACFLSCPDLVHLEIRSFHNFVESLYELSQLKCLEFLYLSFLDQGNAVTAPALVDSLRTLMPRTAILSKSPKEKMHRPQYQYAPTQEAEPVEETQDDGYYASLRESLYDW